MKYVNGLENAMKLIESACEKGEITIIGEGKTPSPEELLVKCAEYISKMYGVRVVVTGIIESKDDCQLCIDDEDEDKIIFDLDGIEGYLNETLPNLMPYVDEDYIKDAIDLILTKCEVLNNNDEVGELNREKICEIVYDCLTDAFDEISDTTLDKVAQEIGSEIEYRYVLIQTREGENFSLSFLHSRFRRQTSKFFFVIFQNTIDNSIKL